MKLKNSFSLWISFFLFKCLYLLMLVITLVPLTYFLIRGAHTVYLFEVAMRYLFAPLGLFMIMAYLYMNYEKFYGLSELVSAITHHQQFYILGCLKVLVVLMVLYHVFLLTVLGICMIYHQEFSVLSFYYLKAWMISFFFPSLIVLMIVTLLSHLKNLKMSSLLMIILLVCISPLKEIDIQGHLIIPYNYILYKLTRLFSITMEYKDHALNSLYGYQLENYHYFIFLFWISFTILVHFHKVIFKKKYFLWVLISSMIFSIYQVYKPQSIYRYTLNSYEAGADIDYYNILKRSYFHKPIIDGHIFSYKLNFQFLDQLYVKGTFQYSTKNTKTYLTLYHGYKINSLKSDSLKSYKQKGDFIELHFSKPVNNEKIDINYQGYSQVFFSNRLAGMLPGYLKYYPVAGKRDIFFNRQELKTVNYKYNVYDQNREAFFDIVVNKDIVTNLKKNQRYHYSGKSDSLTMIFGQTRIIEKQIYNDYPKTYFYDYHQKDYLEECRNKIGNIKKKFENLFLISFHFFDSQKIIVFPRTIDILYKQKDYMCIPEYVNELNVMNYFASRLTLNPKYIDALMSVLLGDNQDIYIENLLEYIRSEGEDTLYNLIQKDVKTYGKKNYMKELGKVLLGKQNESYCQSLKY